MGMNKKGQTDLMGRLVLAIVGISVVLAIGFVILNEFQDVSGIGSEAGNITGSIITSLAGIPSWIGIAITIFMAVIVIGFFTQRT